MGAFAVKDLKKGDLILAERPVLRTNWFDLIRDFENLPEDDQKILMDLHRSEEEENHIMGITRDNG
jgi:hypothetical protein